MITNETQRKMQSGGAKKPRRAIGISGESVQTLNNWYKHKPVLFDVVLSGAVLKKETLKK